MLPTSAIKADAPASGTREKDSAQPALDEVFSTYFTQMVQALPAIQAATPGQVQAAPSPSSTPPAGRSQKNAPEAPASAQPQSQSQVQAPAPGPSAAAAAQAQGSTAPAGTPPTQAPAASGSSSPQASADPSAPVGDAKAAPPAQPAAGTPSLGTAKAAPSQDPGPAVPQAPGGDAPAAATSQDPKAQTLPGRFQVQYDDAPAPVAPAPAPAQATAMLAPADPKAATDAQAAGLPDASLALQPAALAASVPGLEASTLVQALQVSLAGQTALLTPVQAPSATTPGSGTGSGALAAAQALSAEAQPGASGAVRVAAPAETQASLPSGQESLLSQVDGTIRWLIKNQDQGAELQLHPESLGRVQIKLQVEGTVVHAKVWASEPSALPVLQDHRSFLEASLKSQGLTLGSFDLQQGRRQEQEPASEAAGPETAPVAGVEAAKAGQETPPDSAVLSENPSRIEYVA